MLGNLRILEEEDPMLKIVWNEELGEIHAKLMGAVQIEILKSLIKDRFGHMAVGHIVILDHNNRVAVDSRKATQAGDGLLRDP